MADVKTALREMIVRLAKQEVNAKVRTLEKRIAELRECCRLQKKLVAELQVKVARSAGNARPEEKMPVVSPEALKKARLFPALIIAIRKRLGLSGRQFARILGANRDTVYDWESGKSKPTDAYRAKIIALRGISKTRAKELLGL